MNKELNAVRLHKVSSLCLKMYCTYVLYEYLRTFTYVTTAYL